MTRGVIFDLDGTLVDSAPDYVAALNELLESEGRPPVDFQNARACVSRGAHALLRIGFGDSLTDSMRTVMRQRLLDIYFGRLSQESVLFDGMANVLDHLDDQQITWCIVTNKPEFLTTPLVKALSLNARAACIVSGDTLAHAKPHPEPILHACEVAGLIPASSMMVGDAIVDIEAGRAAGLATVIARYGYISADDDTTAWKADFHIDAPVELLGLL